MERQEKEVREKLKEYGFVLDRINRHHIYKHPCGATHITVSPGRRRHHQEWTYNLQDLNRTIRKFNLQPLQKDKIVTKSDDECLQINQVESSVEEQIQSVDDAEYCVLDRDLSFPIIVKCCNSNEEFTFYEIDVKRVMVKVKEGLDELEVIEYLEDISGIIHPLNVVQQLFDIAGIGEPDDPPSSDKVEVSTYNQRKRWDQRETARLLDLLRAGYTPEEACIELRKSLIPDLKQEHVYNRIAFFDKNGVNYLPRTQRVLKEPQESNKNIMETQEIQVQVTSQQVQVIPQSTFDQQALRTAYEQLFAAEKDVASAQAKVAMAQARINTIIGCLTNKVA